MATSPSSSDNAKQKRGPKTAAGKAVVRMNALRHGIASAVVPLPAEDARAWESFREGIIDDIEAEGTLERELAGRVAELLWRLRRVAPHEADLAAAARERVPLDFQKRNRWNGPESVEQAEGTLAAAHEALAALGASDDPMNDVSEAAVDVFAAALEAAGADPASLADLADGPTPMLMQATVRSLAASQGAPREAVTRRVAGHLAGCVEEAERALAFVLDEQDRMRRERLLPPEQSLLNLSKYEAHLNRLLYQAVHEIEALQARRRGQPTPLARVQISAGG